MGFDDRQWDAFCGLLEHGWPGEFDDDAANSYRILLGEYEPEQVILALKSLLRGGRPFRPSVAELVGTIEADPSKPTFTEALRVMLRITPIHPDEAALNEAERAHPYIAAFVRAFGLQRLRTLPINDPEYGQLRRNELAQEWERFTDRADQRVTHGLPLEQGEARRQLGPRRPNFAAALPAGGPALLHAVTGENDGPGEAP